MKQSATGYGPALMRAIENLMPEDRRLFNDPWSEKFLPPSWKFWLVLLRFPGMLNFLMKARERLTPGVIGGFICRTRYIDDAVLRAVVEEFDSVVNLGAGMDTRAFRIPGIEEVRYFEMDLPELLDVKKEYIDKKIGGLPANLSLVPIDFDNQDIGEALQKAEYSPSSRTLFIWEGVTQYITRDAIDKVLEYVAKAASGSMIVFTYVLESFIDGSVIPFGLKSLYRMTLKKKDPLWLSGFDPAGMPEFVSRFSLHLIEDVGHEEHMERYIRLVGRDLSVFEIERIVLAEVR
jgi:methyltransferase (TIGR00027 family)